MVRGSKGVSMIYHFRVPGTKFAFIFAGFAHDVSGREIQIFLLFFLLDSGTLLC